MSSEFENDFDIEDIFGKKKRVKTKKTVQEQLFNTLLDESSEFDTLLDASESKQTVEVPQSSKTSFSVRFSVNDTKLDFTTLTPEECPLEVPVDVPYSPVCKESDLTLDQILGDQKSKLLYEEEIDQKLKSSPSTSYSDKSVILSQTYSDKTISEEVPNSDNTDDLSRISEAILNNFTNLPDLPTTTAAPTKPVPFSPPRSADNSDPSCSPVDSSFQDIHCGDPEMIFDLEESDIASPVSQSPEEPNTGGTTSPEANGLEDSSDLTDFFNTANSFTKPPAKSLSSLPNNLLATTENPLALNDEDLDYYPFGGEGGDDDGDKESVTSSNISERSKKKWSSYLKLPSKTTSKETAKTYYQSTVSKLKNKIKKPNGSLESPTSGRVSRTGSMRSPRNSRDKSPVPDFKDIDSPEETDGQAPSNNILRAPQTAPPRQPEKLIITASTPPTRSSSTPPSSSSSSSQWTDKLPTLSLNNSLPKLTPKQQINIFQGCFSILFAVLVHTLILSDNDFLKGILLGAFITTGLGGLVLWVVLPSPSAPPNKSSTTNRDRLRALTETEIVKVGYFA